MQPRLRNIRKTMIIGLAFTFIIGFGTLALAHGWGYGPMRGSDDYGGAWMGPGSHMGYCRPGGWAATLTDQQAAEIERLREEFFKDADPLRRKIFEKRAEIARELAKENPDKAKLERLQREVSNLRADLAQLRLDFRLKVRKVVPNAPAAGMGRGFRHGYGPGSGMMGPGYCW